MPQWWGVPCSSTASSRTARGHGLKKIKTSRLAGSPTVGIVLFSRVFELESESSVESLRYESESSLES